MRQRRARRLLAGYLLILALLTLLPVVGPEVTLALVDAARALGAGGSQATTEAVDAVTNVVLFVPAGLLLGAALPRVRPLVVWLICLAASVAVEIAQAAVVSGREASVVDVATNALGAALGLLVAGSLRRRATTS